MKKTLQIVLLVLLMLVIATPQTFADTWDGTATSWTNGSGTSSDPYLIECAAHLAYLQEMVNGGVSTYSGKYFKITSDIHLDSLDWSGIGTSDSRSFQGSIDGDGHSILGLNTNIALFNYVKNATISNLIVRGFSRKSGIVHNASSVTISNCICKIRRIRTDNSTSVTDPWSGGIAGKVSGTVSITNCKNYKAVYHSLNVAPMYTGGIVGYVQGSGTVTISNCGNEGAIQATDASSHPENQSVCWYAGGIIGYGSSSTTIKNCYNTASVQTYPQYIFNDPGTSYAYVGGISGLNGVIDKCYNLGNATASLGRNKTSLTLSNNTKFYVYSGGIVGKSGTVKNSYNRGNVNANACQESANNNAYEYSAGIGYDSRNTNCYNVGTLTAPSTACNNYYTYGIGAGTSTNCYYLSTCGSTSGNGTSKTDIIMKSTSMPVLLNATEEIFRMDLTPNVNAGYPIFGFSVGEVTTNAASNINFHSAKLNGEYTTGQLWPSGDADVQGFIYKAASAASYDTVYTNVGTPMSCNITNLTPGTRYNFNAFVTKNGLTLYGVEKSFTTISCVLTLTVAVNASATEICQGESATFTASGSSVYSDSFSYRWNTGATTAIINPTTAGTYTVTVTDTNGCTATKSTTLTVNPLPVGTISGRTSICSGNSTTLTASGANSYTWSTGATTPTLTTSTAGTYTCTFRNTYSCTSTQDVTISVFTAPTITGTSAICSGNSTTLTASGADSYSWNTGATTPSITVSEGGTYTVTGTTSDGCSGSAGITVSVGALPTIAINGNTSFCQGGSTVLTATGGTSYEWVNGTSGNSLTVNAPGTYTVTGTNASGCSNTASVTVTMNPTYIDLPVSAAICQGASYNAMGTPYTTAGTYHVTGLTTAGCDSIIDLTLTINPLPTPSITGNTSICQGTSTTLAVLGGTSFLWNNGSTSQAINVNQSGVYSVTATDANGCSNSTSATVSVNPLPTVTIAGPTAICSGSSATLTASGADSYLWNNGSNDQSLTVTNAGTYTVTGTNAYGCQNTASATISVNPSYNNVTASQAICEGTTYNFFGTILNTTGNYTHNGTTLAGCDSIVNLTLTVNSLPAATINGNTSFCEGESTTLTATGGVSYVWNNGTTTSSITVANGGAYSVTATDVNGCSNTASAVVTANPLPNVIISGSTTFCQGGSTILTAQGADSYSWNTGSSNASIPVYSAGTYSVTGTSAAGCSNTATANVSISNVYNIPVSESICQGNSYNFYGQNLTTTGTYSHTLQTPAGCDSVINLTLTVNPLPTATINGNTSFCEGENTTLTATGGVSYVWNNGTTTPSITVTNSGTYSVTATDANGCSNTASAVVTANQLPNITISGNTAFCEGSSTVLTAQGGNSYTWSNGAQTAYITVTSSGNYTVTGVGSNGCSNTASVSVSATPLPTITINGNTSFCQGGSTTLTATGADSYTWNNGTTTPSITVDAFGIYSVVGSTAIGCTGTASVTVTVSPNPTITISGDTELCPDETTTLTANGGTSYMWFDGSTNSTYQTSTAGSYSVIGYNDAGCHAMATAEVVAYPDAESEETATATGSYTWNGETYTESGDYTFVTTTAHGCDSTVTLHLTIEEGGNDGIDDISADDIKVYVNGRNIVIEGSLDESVMVYDVMGRTIYHDVVRAPITAPATGVYMVKVGNAKARKVVVLR